MTSNLAKIIIEQFFCIVDETAKRCCICWDKCLIKIVTRLHVDQLIIEIFHNNNNCNCDINSISSYLPLPLVTIDFTDVKHKNIKCDKWIRYLEIKASELLNKLEAAKGNIITNFCCPPKKPECVPVNNCNCTFREEYTLCPCEPCRPKDKPYDDWCKPCKKPKNECKCYKEPKCPIKHIKCNDNHKKCDDHKKCEKRFKCKPVKLFKCKEDHITSDDHDKCEHKCNNDHKKCEPIKCKPDKHKKCEPIKCKPDKHKKCDEHKKCEKKHNSDYTDSDSDLSDLSSFSETFSCSDLLSLCDKFCLSEKNDVDHKKHDHKKYDHKKCDHKKKVY